jgi:hypothetical protein
MNTQAAMNSFAWGRAESKDQIVRELSKPRDLPGKERQTNIGLSRQKQLDCGACKLDRAPR